MAEINPFFYAYVLSRAVDALSDVVECRSLNKSLRRKAFRLLSGVQAELNKSLKK